VLLALAAVLGLGFWAARPVPLAVETAVVTSQPLLVTVEEQGRTRAREPYTVAAPVTGALLRTALIEGDRVSAGQILASIAIAPDDGRTAAVLVAAEAAAEARERVAAAALEEAASASARALQESQRRETLFTEGLIAREEREAFAQSAAAAQAREANARAALQAAAAERESARSQRLGGAGDKSTLDVLAPAAGTVQRVFEKSERVVAAGTPLFQISNGDALELVVDLLTQEAVLVRPGNRLLVSGWGGEQTLEGVVRYVEPQAFTKFSALGVEEQRVNVIGELLSPNPGLGAEYRIEAAIVVDAAEAVLSVPMSALFRRAGQWQVFAVVEGRVQLRELQIGRRNSAQAEVIAGLAEGERVVVFPSDLVLDGIAVRER
jgi:HlyD family secretion protein